MKASIRLLLLTLLATAGCYSQHYLVSSRATPLYDADGAEVATLPRYAHGWVEGDDGPRLRVQSSEGTGYVSASDLRVFDVVDPVWDGGADYRETLRDERRLLRVELEGEGWAPEVRDAVRDGRIRKGMRREHVEVAWGWPLAIEPDASGEVWVYRHQGFSLQRVDSTYPFPYPWGFSLGLGFGGGVRSGYWRAVWHPYHHRVRVEVPVVREFRVHFDLEGRVTHVSRRSFLEE